MNCLEAIDVMGDAAEDRLDPSCSAGFQEHMEECPACAAYYEQLRLTRLALKHLPATDGGSTPRRSELVERFRREFEKPAN
jgi:anti-sigma factor RsiW